jgi:hypothetical protein
MNDFFERKTSRNPKLFGTLRNAFFTFQNSHYVAQITNEFLDFDESF